MNFTLSDITSIVSAGGVIFSVIVAMRALRHNRQLSSDDDVANDTRSRTILEEHAKKFDRMFDAQTALNEKFVEHVTDCAKEKAVAAERMAQQAATLERVNNRLDSVARTLGNVTYDAVKHATEKEFK